MAGSYLHLLGGWSMIENMGDAHEVVEELFWLVQSEIGEEKSKSLLSEKFYPMSRNEIEKNETYRFIKKKMSE